MAPGDPAAGGGFLRFLRRGGTSSEAEGGEGSGPSGRPRPPSLQTAGSSGPLPIPGPPSRRATAATSSAP